MLCCVHPLTDKVDIVVHKVDDAVVIFGVGITQTSALHYLKSLQGYFYRLDALAVNGGREYEGVFLVIISIGKYTMLHFLALFVKLIHTLKHMDKKQSVRKGEVEKVGFLFEVCGFFVL